MDCTICKIIEGLLPSWRVYEDENSVAFRSVHRVAGLLRHKRVPPGLNVTQANGRAAWQDVFHYHVHLIPRYGDDGFRPPWRSTSPSTEQLSDVQRQLLQK